jgi:SAM-dependent methyltransferase
MSPLSRRTRSVLRTALRPWRRAVDGVVDRRLGISTNDYRTVADVVGAHQDARPYEAMYYRALRHFVAPLQLTDEDVAIDIGCGQGRVTAWLARGPIRRSIGVEIDPALAEVARQNVERVRGRRAEVDVRVGDGCDVDLTDVTVVFLFNPFGAASTTTLLDNLDRSLRDRPRRIRLAYAFPQHAHLVDARPTLVAAGGRSWPLYTTARYWTNAVAGPEAAKIGP